jgi:hypothetical protein
MYTVLRIHTKIQIPNGVYITPRHLTPHLSNRSTPPPTLHWRLLPPARQNRTILPTPHRRPLPRTSIRILPTPHRLSNPQILLTSRKTAMSDPRRDTRQTAATAIRMFGSLTRFR